LCEPCGGQSSRPPKPVNRPASFMLQTSCAQFCSTSGLEVTGFANLRLHPRRPNGARVKPRQHVEGDIIPALRKAGIPWHGFYSLRRFYGTLIREQSGSSDTASKALGNSKDVADRHYIMPVAPRSSFAASDESSQCLNSHDSRVSKARRRGKNDEARAPVGRTDRGMQAARRCRAWRKAHHHRQCRVLLHHHLQRPFSTHSALLRKFIFIDRRTGAGFHIGSTIRFS